MLNQEQVQRYVEDGYLILRNAINEETIERLERGVANNPPLDQTLDPYAPVYPAPGRYTLATQAPADPDLGFIIEHPTIVHGAETLLDDEIVLTAYVIYDRTPKGSGLGAHHDYKRWRPVGSSMRWLFAIVPFCDYNEETGQLFIAPGSHLLDRIHTGSGRCLEVSPAVKPEPENFIDPQLRRGDLLFMNMHLWHKAAPNLSTHHRVGLFNKYAAASHPPATGYYLFNNKVADNLSPEGRKLIAVHSDLDILTTRTLLLRKSKSEWEVYLQKNDAGQNELPGGEVWQERAIPDWDLGNHIAPAQSYLREQVQIETPWLSYVGDFAEGDGLCRLYAYELNDNGFPVPFDGCWVGKDGLNDLQSAHPWITQALATWLDESITRGKGVSQGAARVDQFAY
ncbi:MAG: phytanoyl-CoA dioxygenase family protein [Pseudomonadota bacterium]